MAGILERLPQLAVVFLERAGNAEPHRAGLAGDAAAGDSHADVSLLVQLDGLERLDRDRALVLDGEIVLHGATVDGDFAGAASRQPHACHRGLAAACSQKFLSLSHIKNLCYASSRAAGACALCG